jgi:hypothetical protein
MADLIVSFTGMALIGHGPRGEAFLLNTDRVQLGHKHEHGLKIGTDTSVKLHGGKLITFYSNGTQLSGALAPGAALQELVDLDAELAAQHLRPELAVATPQPGGPWTNMLAAWLRLPSGTVTAVVTNPLEVWDFPVSGQRKLTEQIATTTADVAGPVVVRITSPDGSSQSIEVPLEEDAYRVTVTTTFIGSPSPLPKTNTPTTLGEVLLLYACVTPGPANLIAVTTTGFKTNLPTRIFTGADLIHIGARPTTSNDVTICPIGAKRL